MKIDKSDNSVVVAAILFNLIFVCFVLLLPKYADTVYIQNYLVDAGSLLAITVLVMHYLRINSFNIFDPIYFITAIYAGLYFIAPIHDILIGKYTWFGYYLLQYGINSGVYALIGYIAFYVFYSGAIRKTYFSRQGSGNKASPYLNNEPDKNAESQIVLLIFFLYVFTFAANVYYLIHSGYANLLYILTAGLLGKGNQSAETINSIGFIAMFSYMMPTTVLLYWEYGKRKWLTVVLFIPVLMMQITRGFRFLVIQIAITFTAYYFIKVNKRPKLRQMILLVCVLMVPVLLMTIFRNDIRSGTGMTIAQITPDTFSKALDDAIWDNLRIYNNYYAIVHSVPSRFPYVYLRQILIGTLVMVIPRILWPGKIDTGAGEDLSVIIGRRLTGTGQAYPGLGEFYYALGIFGIFFFMALYGLWMRSVKARFLDNPRRKTDVIMFGVLLGANLQILIRGYTPSNFWYVVFSIIPVYLVDFLEDTLCRKKS